MNDHTYLQFLGYCLDDRQELPESAKCIDWMEMMEWAEQQAVVGIIYHGMTDGRCQKEDGRNKLQIPFDALMEWIGYAQQIETQNKLLNKRCVELTAELRTAGFDCCILKGQGNALLYPNPLWRTSGDIDVWVMPRERFLDAPSGEAEQKVNGSRFNVKEVIRFVKGRNPEGRALYHHIDLGEYKGVEVEVHYRPSFMFNPVHNYRLQRWFRSHTESTEITELPNGVGCISVPSWEFNIVFQLSHVYNHLLHEGIGLKQIVDYYYLLKSNTNRLGHTENNCHTENTESTEKNSHTENTESTERVLAHLGMRRIAGAMMWVLNEVLGLSEEFLIAPKDEKRGRVLLAEIMKGGNFGHYDAENQKANNAIKKNIQRVKRDIRMVRYFPSECLWEPVFRIYHYFWRIAN